MVLKRKYVFESRGTRLYRHFLSVVVIIVSLFLCYSFACVLLLLDARNEGRNSKSSFVETPPDLIVVFTGGPRRIQFAVKKAQELKQPNVFITGVHQNNSVQSLIDPITPSTKETDHIELDYIARNTVENVISTLKYLRNNRGLNKILIVSSDYHITRIKTILRSLVLPEEPFEFFYSPVSTDYLALKNIKILYLETFKLLRTHIFLMYWDKKSPITNFY